MIRTTAVPRSVRTGAAIAGVAGVIALAGCAAPAADAETEPGAGEAPAAGSSAPAESPAPADGDAAAGAYADGTYTATGSYQTPESVEEINVTITLADDVVTDVEVTGNPTKAESRQYQGEFIGGIADVVVGEKIDDLSVSRVAGSSLTSGGFNQALDEIKGQAAA